MKILIDALCSAQRPESILTWKRSPKVQRLLSSLATGATPITHAGLDAYDGGREVDHLRAILVQTGLLPTRDPYLAHFEQWITTKTSGLSDEIKRPITKFATWHHLRNIRRMDASASTLRGPVHNAKQEITQAIDFLTWLKEVHGRTAGTCTQQDLTAWLAGGPTTRWLIRAFIVFAHKTRINTTLEIHARPTRHSPCLTQEQRLAWLRELLADDREMLSYRVAGALLLLYAQPLVKIAALPTSTIEADEAHMTILLGQHPVPVLEPFDGLLRQHLAHRSNLRTTTTTSPWLFPGRRAGTHLHPASIMSRLRDLGINLRGARNRALTDLVVEVPPPVVADALGYTHQAAQRHADAEAAPWSRYISAKIPH
ncbi:recombinase XerD [Leekyejoonella antrihumi]|nr:recombinase XerD [Leekyejoonella antrihumi]